ncbi:hypothetical protein N8940_01920 [Sphingomonadaceae bacterium]|nr:hypothetical protein [Sphingomonadaceae bacterium]
MGEIDDLERNSKIIDKKNNVNYNELELLSNGLVYELTGFDSRKPGRAKIFDFYFNSPEDPAGRTMEWLVLNAGPHPSGAENAMPVMRTMLDITRRLVTEMSGVMAVGWEPLRSIMGRDYFCKIASDWANGGPFPVLGLTGLKETDDGALRSEGLAFFTGQELLMNAEIAEDRVSAAKLAVRLINELVGKAPVTEDTVIAGLTGEPLQLSLSSDGRLLRIGAA